MHSQLRAQGPPPLAPCSAKLRRAGACTSCTICDLRDSDAALSSLSAAVVAQTGCAVQAMVCDGGEERASGGACAEHADGGGGPLTMVWDTTRTPQLSACFRACRLARDAAGACVLHCVRERLRRGHAHSMSIEQSVRLLLQARASKLSFNDVVKRISGLGAGSPVHISAKVSGAAARLARVRRRPGQAF